MPSPGNNGYRGVTRFAELWRRSVGRDLAAQTAGSPRGPWRLSNSPALAIALSNAFFTALGLATVGGTQACLTRRTAVYGPACTVVWEGRSREASPYPMIPNYRQQWNGPHLRQPQKAASCPAPIQVRSRRRGVNPVGSVGATAGPDPVEAVVATFACHQRVDRRRRVHS